MASEQEFPKSRLLKCVCGRFPQRKRDNEMTMTTNREITEWRRPEARNFIRVGDVVRVRGFRGLYRVTKFKEEHVNGGSTVIAILYGGPTGYAMTRTVHASRLIRKPSGVIR